MNESVLEAAMKELTKTLFNCGGKAVVHLVREGMPHYVMGRKRVVAPVGCRELHVEKPDGTEQVIRLWRLEDQV